jgi:hypothetical protein
MPETWVSRKEHGRHPRLCGASRALEDLPQVLILNTNLYHFYYDTYSL